MYADYSPYPTFPRNVDKILVLEKTDRNITADEIIGAARCVGATNRDADRNEIFWIIYEKEPKRLWDFTEKCLRDSLKGDRPLFGDMARG